jgi:exosome complex component RRP4
MTESKMNVDDKSVAVPGEVLATGMDFLPSYGTYRSGDEIYASMLGLVRVEGKVIKLLPLSGKYLPKRNDTIIGRVTDININGWRIDTNSAYSALLSMKDGSEDYIRRGADLSAYFQIGDFLVCKIINVTSQFLIDLTVRGPGLGKIEGGRIIYVGTAKVPRIIGKQGSMVSMIKKSTGTNILVGQNGIVWVKGDPKSEILTVNTIKKIECESHTSGLTEKVREFLLKNGGKDVV